MNCDPLKLIQVINNNEAILLTYSAMRRRRREKDGLNQVWRQSMSSCESVLCHTKNRATGLIREPSDPKTVKCTPVQAPSGKARGQGRK